MRVVVEPLEKGQRIATLVPGADHAGAGRMLPGRVPAPFQRCLPNAVNVWIGWPENFIDCRLTGRALGQLDDLG